MAVSAFRSELVYRAPVHEGSQKTSLVEGVQKLIDSVVEYPGSRKGEFGEWRLTDWLEGKARQIVGGGGTERR